MARTIPATLNSPSELAEDIAAIDRYMGSLKRAEVARSAAETVLTRWGRRDRYLTLVAPAELYMHFQSNHTRTLLDELAQLRKALAGEPS